MKTLTASHPGGVLHIDAVLGFLSVEIDVHLMPVHKPLLLPWSRMDRP